MIIWALARYVNSITVRNHSVIYLLLFLQYYCNFLAVCAYRIGYEIAYRFLDTLWNSKTQIHTINMIT